MTACWFWISLPAYTFGLCAQNGRVVQVPPIAGWTLGKRLTDVLTYYRSRGAAVVRLPDYSPVSPSGGGEEAV